MDPSHGRAKVGRPARTYIQQLCEDTGCSPEDLPEAMNDREKWWKRVRDICADGTTRCWSFLSLCWGSITIWKLFMMELSVILAACPKKCINTVDTWQKLEEIIRYLSFIAFDHKKNILSQQFLAMATKLVGIKYSSDIVICVFV